MFADHARKLAAGPVVARLESQNELNTPRTGQANLAAARGQLTQARNNFEEGRTASPYQTSDLAGTTASAAHPIARRSRLPHVVSAPAVASLVPHLAAVLCLGTLADRALDGRLTDCHDSHHSNDGGGKG
jgi:hypothetical protein